MTEDRMQTIRDIWQSNQGLYVVAGIFIGLLLYPALTIIFADLFGLLENLVPEAVGIVFTVLFIDRLNQRREEQRRIRDLQEQLIREAGSSSHDTAIRAVEIIKKRGWLEGDDGILQGADLSNANLEGADLEGANLQDTDFLHTNLEGANLLHTNLKGANLWEANLKGANLRGANLQGSGLRGANLHRAHLKKANLRDAYLFIANLQDAILIYTKFNEETTLPDNIKCTPDTDMNRFTDPNHPDFWQHPYWAKKDDDNTDT